MEISVRAYPAQGHDYRRRAGRAWSKSAVVVSVVDYPSAPNEISHAQYAEIAKDPMIATSPVGMHDPEMLGEKAERINLQDKIEKLRAEYAGYVETSEAEHQKLSLEVETMGDKIRKLEIELDARPAKKKA